MSATEFQASAETKKRNSFHQNLGHLDWFQKQKFDALCDSLSYPKERDPTEETVRKELTDRANEELAKVTGGKHTKGHKPTTELQKKRNALQTERNRLNDKKAEAEARLNCLPREVSAVRAEQGTEQARLETGSNVRCSICHVSIDEVTANGCCISLERCDLEQVRMRINQAEQEIENLERQRKALPDAIAEISTEIDLLDRQIADIDDAFLKLEKQFLETDQNVLRAKNLVREATDFDRQLNERATIVRQIEGIDAELDDLRESVRRERERSAANIGNLESIFQQLVACLMPRGCSGKLRLDGNGLHPEILLEHGAGLSTAAVESFKIVAFDLAAMILAVNGKANIPPFLIHDSPREADLDAAIYENLFNFILDLEQKASPPPFQYIITTTTEPSPKARNHAALRLKLSSTPANARLFTMDF